MHCQDLTESQSERQNPQFWALFLSPPLSTERANSPWGSVGQRSPGVISVSLGMPGMYSTHRGCKGLVEAQGRLASSTAGFVCLQG